MMVTPVLKWKTQALLAVSLASSAVAMAGQIDITTFNTLRRGMSESEVLIRAGPPDLVDTIRVESVGTHRRSLHGRGSIVTRSAEWPVRQLHYIPAPDQHDPHLTVITIRDGVVSLIERTKVFGRIAPGPEPAAARRRSDHDLKIRRAERTLEAARAYAATRARLKAEAESASPKPDFKLRYRTVQPDGSVYFGDKPPD